MDEYFERYFFHVGDDIKNLVRNSEPFKILFACLSAIKCSNSGGEINQLIIVAKAQGYPLNIDLCLSEAIRDGRAEAVRELLNHAHPTDDMLKSASASVAEVLILYLEANKNIRMIRLIPDLAEILIANQYRLLLLLLDSKRLFSSETAIVGFFLELKLTIDIIYEFLLFLDLENRDALFWKLVQNFGPDKFDDDQKEKIIELLVAREKMDRVDRLVKNGWPRPSSYDYDTHTLSKKVEDTVFQLRTMPRHGEYFDQSDEEYDSDADYMSTEQELKATLTEEKEKKDFPDFINKLIHRINYQVKQDWDQKREKERREYGNLDPDTSLINKLKWLEKKFGPFDKESKAYRQMLWLEQHKVPEYGEESENEYDYTP
jgi:hypothetical protein